jgi:predicted MFS family arabinose efflux permease
VYEVNQVSLRQAITADRLLGRVNAGTKLSGQGSMLIGALVGGLLGETVGLRGTLVIAASGVLLAAAWLAVSPVRGLRTPPLADEPASPPIAEPGPAVPI